MKLADEEAASNLADIASGKLPRHNSPKVALLGDNDDDSTSGDSESDGGESDSESSDSDLEEGGEEGATPKKRMSNRAIRRMHAAQEKARLASPEDLTENGYEYDKEFGKGAFQDAEGNQLNVIEDKEGTLVDKSGNIWSTVILHTDTTQKTVPGMRVISFRALVFVGNLKGAGGFGMGKGNAGAEAITAACR
jgi:hypothetical protein